MNRGRYNFDRVRYEVYRDATVIRESFRKGLVDIWTETDVRYWASGYDTPAFERGWIRKMRRQFGIEVGVRSSIALNNRQPRFQDRRVREALTLAMDFEWQNRALHHGYHKRAHSYWPDTILAATGLPSEGELALLAPFRDRLPAALFERPFRFPEAGSAEDRRAHLVPRPGAVAGRRVAGRQRSTDQRRGGDLRGQVPVAESGRRPHPAAVLRGPRAARDRSRTARRRGEPVHQPAAAVPSSTRC